MEKSTIKKGFQISILVIGLLGLLEILSLVKDEILIGETSPKILGIPASFLLLNCILLILISHTQIFGDKHWVYFSGVVIGGLIALGGAIGQMQGWISCPETASGNSTCFVFLILFFILGVLKLIELNEAKNND